jgi:nicotinamidase/pyrazinamidase
VVAVLISQKTIFWQVDAQRDFMLPGGKLYVPGAEKILPNINRLVEAVRQGRVFLISSADAHNPNDPELREWPPHCLKGSSGADLVAEASAPNQLIIPNEAKIAVPQDLGAYHQLILQKNTLDVFDNPHTDALLKRFSSSGSPTFGPHPEFVVFGVATDYCVQRTAEGLLRRGQRVAIVTDAVRSIDPEKGSKVLANLHSNGARLITAGEALALVCASP